MSAYKVKMHKIIFRVGIYIVSSGELKYSLTGDLPQAPLDGAYSSSPDPVAGLKGPTSALQG